jgi:hypothetical protein
MGRARSEKPGTGFPFCESLIRDTRITSFAPVARLCVELSPRRAVRMPVAPAMRPRHAAHATPGRERTGNDDLPIIPPPDAEVGRDCGDERPGGKGRIFQDRISVRTQPPAGVFLRSKI